MPDLSGWTVFVRDGLLRPVAQIDDYQSLDVVTRFNDVETWTLDMDASVGGASLLQQDGAGIVLVRDATTVFSGPVARRERDWGTDKNRLKVSGPGDTIWLARRLAHPQPTTSAPPYNSQADDVRTGTCSTILRQYVDFNLGPSALSVRQVPSLTLAADPALGTTVTGRARWDPLLKFLQDLALAGGALGFLLQQSGSGIVFSVYQPVDRSASVIFSPDLGNLGAYDWSEAAPISNWVVVGGGGVGTARTIYEGSDASSIARWGRVETFRDQRQTTVAAELTQAASDELAQSAGPMGLSITPIDLPQMTYLAHYRLGDKVTVIKDGVSVSDLIREVHITLTPQDGARIIPAIGTPGRQDLIGFFDRLRKLTARVINLEKV
jgi:Siphovirus ReqiPepy6 Gp37-like protein